MNKYTVILDCGKIVDVTAPGFLVGGEQLSFPQEFKQPSGTLSIPFGWVAVFPIEKVSCLMAEHDRDATNESGWDEIGGMRAVSVGELSQLARRQTLAEERERQCNETLKKLREAQAELDALRSGAVRPNLGVATKATAEAFHELQEGKRKAAAYAINWPKYAKYRAFNPDGSALFFANHPYITPSGWDSDDEVQCVDLNACPNWRETLIKRPD